MPQKPKVVQISTPTKGKQGLTNALFVHGHNSPLEYVRELFKPSKDQ